MGSPPPYLTRVNAVVLGLLGLSASPLQMLPSPPQFSSQNSFHRKIQSLLKNNQVSSILLEAKVLADAHLLCPWLPFLSSPHSLTPLQTITTPSFYHANKPGTLLLLGVCVSIPCAWNTLPPNIDRVFLSPSSSLCSNITCSVRLSLNTLHILFPKHSWLIYCTFFLICFESVLV